MSEFTAWRSLFTGNLAPADILWYSPDWGNDSWELEWATTNAEPVGFTTQPLEWYQWSSDNIEFRFDDRFSDLPGPALGALRLQTIGNSSSGDFRGPSYTQDLTDAENLVTDIYLDETSGGSQDREARIRIDGTNVFYDESNSSSGEFSGTWSDDVYEDMTFDVSGFEGLHDIQIEMRDDAGTSAGSVDFVVANTYLEE